MYAASLSPDQRFVYVISAGGASAGSNAITAFTRDPGTGSLAFASCISATGGDGRVGSDGLCAHGDALLGAHGLAISADGRSAYAVAAGANAITWFDRDPATGALTQKGCLKQAIGPHERCTLGYALGGAAAVSLSPDEKFVYVASASSGAVAVFSRDAATGALTELSCVSDTGSDGQCTDGVALAGARGLVLPADGKNVYVTSSSGSAVIVLNRDADTGALTPAGCLLADAPAGGPCVSVRSLEGAASGALSGDGRTLYVAAPGESTLVQLNRDPATGGLAFAGCLQHTPPAGADAVDNPDYYDSPDETFSECAPTKALESITQVAVSKDGRAVYGAGYDLAAFNRDGATGALSEFGCAQEDLEYHSCTPGRAISDATSLAASDDGRSLYVLNGYTNSVAVYVAALAITSSQARMTHDSVQVHLACPRRAPPGCAGTLSAGAAPPASRCARARVRPSGWRCRDAPRAPPAAITTRPCKSPRMTAGCARRPFPAAWWCVPKGTAGRELGFHARAGGHANCQWLQLAHWNSRSRPIRDRWRRRGPRCATPSSRSSPTARRRRCACSSPS